MNTSNKLAISCMKAPDNTIQTNAASLQSAPEQEAKPRVIMLLGFSLIIIFMIIITTAALSSMNHMEGQLDKIVNHYAIKTNLITSMRTAARERIHTLHKMLSIDDPFEFDDASQLFYQYGSQFLEYREKLKSMPNSSAELDLLEKLNTFTGKAGREQNDVFSKLQNGNKNAATLVLINKATPAQDQTFEIIDDLLHLQKNKSEAELSLSISDLNQSTTLLISILIIACVLAVAVALYVIKHISNAFCRVRAGEAREKSIRENMLEALITINQQGIMESCNASAENIFGYNRDELIGQNVSMLMPTPHREHHDEYIQNYLTTGKAKIIGIGREVTGQRKDGSLFPLILGVTKLVIDEQPLFIGIINDISKRKAAEEALRISHEKLEERVEKRTRQLTKANRQLEILIQEKVATQARLTYLANYDELTALPNRTLFYERLHIRTVNCKRNKCSFALLFLDLDGFKLVNDNLGHDIGDELLKQVAKRMTDCLRESDDIARIGGDEFTVMISLDTDEKSTIEMVAHKIIDAASAPYEISEHKIEIGTSIGISIYPDDTDNQQTLIKFADEAMYEVKNKGKNNFIYYRDISDSTAP